MSREMTAAERGLYLLDDTHRCWQPDEIQGFVHRVLVVADNRRAFPNNVNHAIYWINTHEQAIAHQFCEDSDLQGMIFWFRDAQIAFEFKIRFG